MLVNLLLTIIIMIVKIKKLNENAVIPKFGKPGDGCQDVVAVSCKYNPKYDRFEYGLGFATEFEPNYKARICPRSSNTKTDAYIPNSPACVDSNYRGEWMVMYKLRTPFEQLFPEGNYELNLLEMENELAPYKVGDRIGQIVIMPFPKVEFEEVEKLPETDRGSDGGINRTDNNFK